MLSTSRFIVKSNCFNVLSQLSNVIQLLSVNRPCNKISVNIVMDRDKTVFITNTPCNTLGKPVYKIVFKYEILYESYLSIFKFLSIKFLKLLTNFKFYILFSLKCALLKPISSQLKMQSMLK